MKSLSRLWAFLLIVGYFSTLGLPLVAMASTAPQPSCTLSITPSVVSPGSSATIKWTSTNATAGAITRVGNVGANGSAQITPPTTSQITVYIGSFTGPGGTANCTASVQISYGSSGANSSTGSNTTGATPVVTPVAVAPIVTGGTAGPQSALVQCGYGSGTAAVNCEACNLAQLFQNIINFAIGLSIPIAAVLFAYAGILYITSGANHHNMDKAREIFSNAFIGFLIAITAWLVINTLLHALLDGGKLFKSGSSWFTVQCSPEGTRPVNGNINQVINSILPGVNTQNPVVATGAQGGNEFSRSGSAGTCPPGYSYLPDADSCSNADGTSIVNPNFQQTSGGRSCPAGYVYLPDAETCSDSNGNEASPLTTGGSGTRGIALCANGNTNCDPATLQQQGLTDAQATTMSCIAMTENAGQAVGCSGTGPCGTFQISRTNWQQYAPAGCSAANFGGNITAAQNNAQCNLQTAAVMVQAQGYQPWTGNNNGVYWNTNARTCVNNYDPANLR